MTPPLFRPALTTACLLALASLGVGAQAGKPAAKPPTAAVYLSPTCGCCSKWVEHLKAAGFAVTSTVTPDLESVPARLRVPERLKSCHTAVVGSYLVEGHIPADVVQRLLRERPAIEGIAVPGMPIGSPGMEGPNPQPYIIVAFRKDGTVYEFARR
ncbi:MAG TPA: DUF411 domain-containing protein [Vicinamibacterales bacterium]|nr:DUF411 domain-containing protein [Vicinamibacterales bacterium]